MELGALLLKGIILIFRNFCWETLEFPGHQFLGHSFLPFFFVSRKYSRQQLLAAAAWFTFMVALE